MSSTTNPASLHSSSEDEVFDILERFGVEVPLLYQKPVLEALTSLLAAKEAEAREDELKGIKRAGDWMSDASSKLRVMEDRISVRLRELNTDNKDKK